MKVHLIKQQTIQNFIDRHAPARRSFESWITTIKYADWSTPEEIQNTFGSADLLGQGSNRVVFNIGGNNYRLIAKYFFGAMNAHLFVKWIGTHTEYDELCDQGKQYTVDDF
jgi:mRNA interferase HigB